VKSVPDCTSDGKLSAVFVISYQRTALRFALLLAAPVSSTPIVWLVHNRKLRCVAPLNRSSPASI
jgi:hypothetical protein